MYYLKVLSDSVSYAISTIKSFLNPVCSSEVILSYRDGKKTVETVLIKRRFGKPQKVENTWTNFKAPEKPPIPYIHVYAE